MTSRVVDLRDRLPLTEDWARMGRRYVAIANELNREDRLDAEDIDALILVLRTAGEQLQLAAAYRER